VALRSGTLTQIWRVSRIEGDNAVLIPAPVAEEECAAERARKPLAELLVVKQFGEPIFPTLTPVDSVSNGADNAPWHALIEADNYHALQLLGYVYAGKVDCVYIDPPYNTGARDWKYNNDYIDGNDSWRHSKWLSFMERRLRLAKRMLKPDTGVLICTIDEHEVHHLGNLLEEIFPETSRQLVTIVINQKGVSQRKLSRVEEYAIFCFFPEARVPSHFDDLLSRDRRNEKRFQTPRWEWLQRGGNNANPTARSGLFFPVFIDPKRKRIVGAGKPLLKGTTPSSEQLGDPKIAWPIRRDGSYATWQVGPDTLMRLVEKRFVRLGGYDDRRQTWTIQYLGAKAERQIREGLLKITGRDDTLGCVIIEYTQGEQHSIKTVWHRQHHDSGIYGSSILRSILGQGASFTFPKSIYSTLDAIATVTRDQPSAIVLDFFAGSGTTLNAVNLLNAADGGKRQCILVTNNEVAASEAQALSDRGSKPDDIQWEERGICRSVTWPRSKYTILGRRDDGSLLDGDYYTGRTIERPKRRNFKHISFVSPSDFRLAKGLSPEVRAEGTKKVLTAQRALVALINGLPPRTR
jgi:adenine-specific DNA-methyltransferase